ncbi:tripartite tricarboxylate transporter substrate binding protein [Acidovorax sp. Be4]|uniref:Tripartite tricarboxylate transporter substrate binding protein n=1 Tax=Acidovorax bellezanensis TaxID=2976702 RepID=A0ABT2PRQ8_9BURK|nr:tripartite tricarboxylate transporter substrate binding protein [Acidovorax sp. Be4]MCT9812551.1 tripartite tricarboxylate transporter substrate binding protein [Acidovorax sp. Be4]
MHFFKALGLAAAVAAALPLQAQEAFPKRPVTIVVPYSAGGVTDIFARSVGLKLGALWGQPVVVDNRAGAGTIIGTQYVSRAPADGYTLLFTSYAFTSNPELRKNLPYSATAFRPVALLGSSHNILLVTNRLKGKSLAELLALAKTKQGGLTLASSGPGSSPHIGAELFAQQAGIPYTHVPYKGQGPSMLDLTAGVVDGMFDGMSSYAQVQHGAVAAVAIAAPQRHPAAPEIPTFRELGMDLVSGSWFGLLAPAGTPDAVVARINADMRQVLKDAELKAQIAKTGLQVTTSTPEAFGQFLAQESAKLHRLIQQGAKIDIN